MVVYLLVYLSRQHIETCHKQTKPNKETHKQQRDLKTEHTWHAVTMQSSGLLWGVSALGAAGEGLLLSSWRRASCHLGELGTLQKDRQICQGRSSLETSAKESLLHLTIWPCAQLLLEIHTWNIHPWNFPEAAFMHQHIFLFSLPIFSLLRSQSFRGVLEHTLQSLKI